MHFNPRSPRGERQYKTLANFVERAFQSTLPARGATAEERGGARSVVISIHAPREGSDCQHDNYNCPDRHFNPRSPRGERLDVDFDEYRRKSISIHAPREGSDASTFRQCCKRRYFNPRSPRGERRLSICRTRSKSYFNPRSPRGERLCQGDYANLSDNFNPRSPRGERRWLISVLSFARPISIHAPREGSDRYLLFRELSNRNFNPRSPRGERLPLSAPPSSCQRISIHAPREGSDQRLPPRMSTSKYFNPRSPRGERLRLSPLCNSRSKFQSTLPARGATVDIGILMHPVVISIHAPREGSDIIAILLYMLWRDFNPRSPRGERRSSQKIVLFSQNFNPRSPRGERPTHIT